MYKIFFTAFTTLLVITGLMIHPEMTVGEREAIVCHPEDTETDMAAFASNPSFQALHLSPFVIHYNAVGEMMKFKTPDGTDASGYLIKAKNKSDKWLFVYQEWWGLNDHIKKEADKFYTDLGADVNVIALDMYDGKSTTDPK